MSGRVVSDGGRRSSEHERSPQPRQGSSKALLLFFYSPTSGLSRRMDGLVSWLYVRERKRLRLRQVNVELSPDTAESFGVTAVPTLILVKGEQVVARLEGKVTGQAIDDAILPHLRS